MGLYIYVVFGCSLVYLQTLVASNGVEAVQQQVPRELNAEEQELADGARREVAEVLERNLIKFFTLIAAQDEQGGLKIYGRQDDDDDDAPGLNPNTLPQVAQILGAIFSGGLNLTRIVDQSFSLVPTILRNQVEGVFKYLTGGQGLGGIFGITTTTAKPVKKPVKTKVRSNATSKANVTTATTTVETVELELTEATTNAEAEATTTTKSEKRSFNYKRGGSVLKVRDEEIDEDIAYDPVQMETLHSLEEQLIQAAIDAEPMVIDKEPRFFRQPFREIMDNIDSGKLNITQVIKFLPDLFKGARQAFVLLENLGQIAGNGDVDDAEDDD